MTKNPWWATPRDELVSSTLLNRLAPNCAVSTYVCAAIEALGCQRKFVHWMVINIELHNWSKFRERVSMGCSTGSEASVSRSLSSRLREHHRSRVGDNVRRVRGSRGRAQGAQHLWLPAQDLMDIKPISSPACSVEGVTVPNPYLRAFWHWWLPREGESVFFVSWLLEGWPCGWPHTYVLCGQHKLNSVSYV